MDKAVSVPSGREGSSSAKLSNAILDQVKAYSEATGVPITRVLDDAVTFWMTSVGKSRLRVLTSPTSDLSENIFDVSAQVTQKVAALQALLAK